MRSLLFVPGDSQRKFDRALQGDAGALILDLEDSIAPGKKEEARNLTRAMLGSDRGKHTFFVRVNAPERGEILRDLAAIMPASPNGVVLPKCQSAGDVKQLAHWLDAFEAAAGLPIGETRIIAIATETAASIFGLGTYKDCSPRLIGLMWGAEDLAASLGAIDNGGAGGLHSPYRLARDLCLMAAAGANILAIDTVYTKIEDLLGLEQEAKAARRDGFAAKAVIHPSHVAVVNAAFEPSAGERRQAEAIVAAFESNSSLGVIRIDEKMIDKPHLKAAKRLLGIPQD
jgi:citrate lyase subunit beta/citryl-CoA lyase